MTSNHKAISKKTRFEVFKRDSFTCQYCGKSAPEAILHADHIIPKSKGGKGTLMNLVTACSDCNLGKSDKSLDDSSAVKKSHAQAEMLQERKNQLQMMADWYAELEDLSDNEVQIVDDLIKARSHSQLSSLGRSYMAKRIKKYGLKLVMEKAVEAFGAESGSNNGFEESIDRLDKLLKWAHIPFHIQKANYITAVVRNRFRDAYEWHELFKLLLTFILEQHPTEYGKFYKVAANAPTLTDIRDQMLEQAIDLGMSKREIINLWNGK